MLANMRKELNTLFRKEKSISAAEQIRIKKNLSSLEDTLVSDRELTTFGDEFKKFMRSVSE